MVLIVRGWVRWSKMHGLAASVLAGWALWAAQGAVGQEPMHGVCHGGAPSGCAAGTADEATFPTRPPPLFAPASDAAQVDPIEPSTTPSVPRPQSRHQAVQIDFARLSQTQGALAEGRSVELTVNLPDLPLPVVFTTANNTRGGYALSGRVANDPLSAVNIVVNGRSVAGHIRRGAALHTIRTAGAGYYVQTLDGLTGPQCEVEHVGELDRGAAQAPRLESPAAANAVQNDGAADDGTEIDLLVVYTPGGRRSAGGHQGIRTLMELLVQETNQAYVDSDVRQRVRLVAATEVDYALENFNDREALEHLTKRSDGHMDEVHRLRDLYAADLVLLYRPVGGGRAWIVEDPSAASAESWGFAVSNWHAFTHELGHNMGLMHERHDDPGNLPYPYSHGYVFRHEGVKLGTIMSTGEGVFRFSNPRQRYPNDLGVPLGVPGDTPTSSPDGPADAARSLNQTAAMIANFRSSASKCHYHLPSPTDIAAEGGSFAISVTTTANCSWDAVSLTAGLSITGGFSGTGNGQVAFTVEQNVEWRREVAIRVAGEVYSFHQDGRRQAVSVCDRSAGVQEAITEALDNRPCADVAAEDLANIASLTVRGYVSPGDFDGLTGLGELGIRYVDEMDWAIVPRLDPGTFAGAGLENLQHLSLLASRTTPLHLRQGVFEGLDTLQELWLYGMSWDEGVFDDVRFLNQLFLLNYPRNVLPNGAFRGLSRLTFLSSHEGQFETVGARAFQGLSSLRRLRVANGRLARLPAGAFQDLPELTFLSLASNRLTALRRNQFQGASKLSLADFSSNPIRIVDSGAFNSLPLQHLYLIDLDLTSLDSDVFSELNNCTVLLSGNRLTTLDPLAFAGADLFRLDLRDNDISDIRFLSSINSVREVFLGGNKIADISPLADVSGLSILDLSRNRIVDISPLSDLANRLTHLDLSHNEISDVSPLLLRDGFPIGDDGVLFLHGNELRGAVFDEHLAMLRSSGVQVFHIHIWPADSSALEGEMFEFAVRLSSESRDSVSVDWQLVVAEDPSARQAVLANAILTSGFQDVGGLYASCSAVGVCYVRGIGGELTIAAEQRLGYAIVPVRTDDQFVEEHQTFGFVLLPQPSTSSGGVTLDTYVPVLYGLFRVRRHSVAVGLIVDPAGPMRHVPFFLADGDASGRESVLRLVHPMNGSPAHVEVFDALGRKHGATTLSTRDALSLRPPDPSRKAVAQFSSGDLEDGNYDAGLSRGVGPGSSDWHLKVWANDVKVRSYVRHADGVLTSMHDVAPKRDDGAYAVPIFNPADNTRQRSILRLVNPGTEASEVRIIGTDDTGATPGEAVGLSIESGGVRELSAAELEAGTSGLSGALGDGDGRWRLAVASEQPLLVASLVESPDGRLANLSTMPNNRERGAEGATTHHVPLFLSANDQWNRHSFLRILNKSEDAAIVRIRAFDDTDRDYGSVSLTVAAGEAAEFDSHHLEAGGGGLSSGVGAGEGDWRLEVESTANIDVLAYVHHADGFLTAMHDMVRGANGRHVVPIFNPADDDQNSLLRLVNPRSEDAEVSIRGFDDRGAASRSVRLVVPAGRSRTISAQQMEAGHDALEGALGNGEGKWRLVVRSEVRIQVMSLLEGPAGHLTNLSTTP